MRLCGFKRTSYTNGELKGSINAGRYTADYLSCGNLPYPAWKMCITAHLSYRRIRRYSVWRLKRLEARDFSRVRIKFLIHRVNIQSEIANWFGKDFPKLQIAFTSNLGTNAGVMAANGLGYPISIEGAAKYWRENILVQRRISPEITTSTVIAWRRNIPYSLAVSKMIDEINAFQA